MKNTFILLLLLISGQFLQAQSPYQLNWKIDAPIIVGSVGLIGLGQYLEHKTDGLTSVEIANLNRNNINGFDRSATYNSSSFARKVSDVFLYGSPVIPAALLLPQKRIRKDYLTVGVLFAEAGSLTIGLTELTKSLAKRTRPLAYNDAFDEATKMEKGTRRAFFSGHTSSVAVISFFSAKVFADYNPKSKHRIWVWTLAATVPALTGYARYEAGKHFPTDVLVGYALGASIGYFVQHLHKKRFKNNENLSWDVMMSYNGAKFKLIF